MKKINLEPIKEVAIDICKIAGGIGFMMLYRKLNVETQHENNYDDAVAVIMDSSMWSADKVVAIKALKRNETTEYYNSIISIVNSSMYSNDKMKLISELNKEGS